MKLGWTLVRIALVPALLGPLIANTCGTELGKSSGRESDGKDVDRTSDAAPTSDAAQAMRWSEQLRDMGVFGQSVGFAGVPGEFFLLQQGILAAATRDSLDRLLESDIPQARAMALSIMARNPEIGRARLTDYVCDDGEFRYNPDGCVVRRLTVGGFARVLLEEPGVLGGCDACTSPLLGPEELWRLDWHALSSERCTNLHELAASKVLGPRFDAIAARPSLDALDDALPGVEPWRRVKALARVMRTVNHNVDQRPFRSLLVATAASGSLPSSARLAAASALTRAGVDDSVWTLEQLQPELDALDRDEPGQAILWALRGRLVWDVETADLRKSKTWMETEALAPKVISTFERFGGEPFALDLILETGFYSFGAQTDKVRVVVERALEAQLERARYPFADWDIESDLAYRLRRGAVIARDNAKLSGLLAHAGAGAADPGPEPTR